MQLQHAGQEDVGVVAEAVEPLGEAGILHALQQSGKGDPHLLARERGGDASVDAGAEDAMRAGVLASDIETVRAWEVAFVADVPLARRGR